MLLYHHHFPEPKLRNRELRANVELDAHSLELESEVQVSCRAADVRREVLAGAGWSGFTMKKHGEINHQQVDYSIKTENIEKSTCLQVDCSIKTRDSISSNHQEFNRQHSDCSIKQQHLIVSCLMIPSKPWIEYIVISDWINLCFAHSSKIDPSMFAIR